MTKEETSKEKPCNHFMVWNCQGGYSYYRCDKCNYIDGKKTFQAQKQELLEKIEGIIETHSFRCSEVATSVNELREKINQLLK